MSKKLTLCLCLFACITIAHASEQSIKLSRTSVELVADDNIKVITARSNGQIEVRFPKHHKYHGQRIEMNDHNKSSTAFNKSQLIDTQLTAKDLYHDLQNAKNKTSSLFYSSDSDVIQVQITQGQEHTWEISLNNLQELKHFSHELPRWQGLLDLIEAMENLSTLDVIAAHLENHHEK